MQNGNGKHKNGNGHFGKCLHELREKANLNLHGLAQQLSASSAWLSYLESGQRIPSWSLVEMAAKVLADSGISSSEVHRLKELGKKAILTKVFSDGKD